MVMTVMRIGSDKMVMRIDSDKMVVTMVILVGQNSSSVKIPRTLEAGRSDGVNVSLPPMRRLRDTSKSDRPVPDWLIVVG